MRDMVALLGGDTPSGQVVAKKLRAEQYGCVLLRADAGVETLRALSPQGVIIAYEAGGAPLPDAALLTLDMPLLAVGYPARALLSSLGTPSGEGIEKTVQPVYYREAKIFNGIEAGGERYIEAATAFDVPADAWQPIANVEGMPVAYGDLVGRKFLLQFQMERNDPDATAMLTSFARDVCGCTAWWTQENITARAAARITEAAGDRDAICAMSGGLDSTVAALLARQALGGRVRNLFIDTGLLREGEGEETMRYLTQDLGLAVERIDISAHVLSALQGLETIDAKWRVVEREISIALGLHDATDRVFIKGTNYMDTITGAELGTESHCPTVAPLADLFKDEIRMVGAALVMDEGRLNRQPFPGMGLAARIRGEVTAQWLAVLRAADAIFAEEIAQSGQGKRVDRYFARLQGGDGERCEIVLRAMQGHQTVMNAARLPYDLLERATERILKELPQVERVLYDVTPSVRKWLD